jgi:putative tricarboxylic transport membrane protein
LLRTTFWPDVDLAEQAATEEAVTHWSTVTWIAAVMVLYVFSLRSLGYVVATALFFAAGAWILGSRSGKAVLARNLAIGLLLGVVVYVGFTRFLGVRLPAGLLDFFL